MLAEASRGAAVDVLSIAAMFVDDTHEQKAEVRCQGVVCRVRLSVL